MSLEQYTNQVREKAATAKTFGATIKFAFAEGGALYLDGTGEANVVDNRDDAAQCTVKVSLENFGKLIGRTLDPMTAFVTGKLKVEGDMKQAMNLQKLFG